jgi:hypothetical protein
MKRMFLGILILTSLHSCVREVETISCIKYINDTNHSIVIEIYDGSRTSTFERRVKESINTQSTGLFYSECVSRRGPYPPQLFFATDSIVVKFDSQRLLVSTSSELGLISTGLLNRDNYVVEGTTYTYTFTQQDYDNAMPF